MNSVTKLRSDDSIHNQVNAIGFSTIHDSVRQVGVDVPAFAWRERERKTPYDKFGRVVRGDRNMKPSFIVINGYLVISMLSDDRTGRQ